MNARQKHLHDQEALAVAAFKEHEIKQESEGRWLIMKPGTGVFWTEIICTHHQGLYVDGDIDPVVFRYGPEHPLARVSWMGKRPHAWDGYFREKACIGMGGRGQDDVLHYFDRDVAICDVEQIIEDVRDSSDIRDLSERQVRLMDALRDDVIGMMRMSDEFDPVDVYRELYKLDMWEDCDRIGRVPSNRMFYAHAALQRLHQLLVERGDYDS